jgi:hypothetical protein
VPTKLERWVLYCPDNAGFFAAFIGAISYIANVWPWEGTDEQIAECVEWVNRAVVKTAEKERALYVGEIIYLAGVSSESGILPADGREVSRTEYADLYAVVGDIWGTAVSGFFRLPNIGARFPIGEGIGYALSQTGGNSSVTLGSNNMPVHSHTVHSHLQGLVVAPGELPVEVPGLIPGQTGQAGLGQSFDITPPYVTLKAYIVTGKQ